MKLRYLSLAGLFICCLGCFLPFVVRPDDRNESLGFLFILIPGILFLLISKEGPLGNGRVLGGLYGLMLGFATVFQVITTVADTDGMYKAIGAYIAYQGPIALLTGSLLACVGGFTGYKRSSSRNFQLGTILFLVAIGIIVITAILDTPLSGWLLPFFCLAMICLGSIIMVIESRKIIQ